MRGVGKLPVPGRRIRQDGHQRGLGQRGAQQQPLRVHGEKHVHRPDISVARVFLGEKQGFFMRIRRQAARRRALAVGQRNHLRVSIAAHLPRISHQFLVEFRTTRRQAGIVRRRLAQHLIECGPVALPIRQERLPKIFDRHDFIVGHDHLPADGLAAHPAELEGKSHHRLVLIHRPRHPRIITVRQISTGHKRRQQFLVPADRGRGFRRPRGGIGVAPINPVIIPAGTHHRLLHGPHAERQQPAGRCARPVHRFLRVVHGQL